MNTTRNVFCRTNNANAPYLRLKRSLNVADMLRIWTGGVG